MGKLIPMPSKEELGKDYIVNQLALRDIAKKYSVGYETARRWLKRCDIPLRNVGQRSRIPTKEELYNDYVVNKLTYKQISEKYGAPDGGGSIWTWLKKYNIIPSRVEVKKHPMPTKEELYNDYVVDQLLYRQISIKYGAPHGAIWRWLKEYNIPLRTVGHGRRVPAKEELYEDYVVNKLTVADMQKKYNVTYTTIKDWMKKYDIPLRNDRGYGRILEKEKLYKNYIVDGLTCVQIGEKYGVSEATIRNWLKRYGIPSRGRGSGSRTSPSSPS